MSQGDSIEPRFSLNNNRLAHVIRRPGTTRRSKSPLDLAIYARRKVGGRTMISGRGLGLKLTFVSFLCGGTRTVNARSLTVSRKSLSMSDSIVLDEATLTPSVPDTTTRSTPGSSIFSMSIKSPTVLVTGRNVNWQSSRLDGRGTVIAGSPRRSSTRISANKQNATDVMDLLSMYLCGFCFSPLLLPT